MEIKINMIDRCHQHSYWYGGEAAVIKYKGYIFCIDASGDIRCSLLDENNNELVYVKDKCNTGRFYDEMRHYIKNDSELKELELNGRLVMENNNWWECSMITSDGIWHDLMWCLDSDFIMEAVNEVLDAIDEVISDFKNGYLEV